MMLINLSYEFYHSCKKWQIFYASSIMEVKFWVSSQLQKQNAILLCQFDYGGSAAFIMEALPHFVHIWWGMCSQEYTKPKQNIHMCLCQPVWVKKLDKKKIHIHISLYSFQWGWNVMIVFLLFTYLRGSMFFVWNSDEVAEFIFILMQIKKNSISFLFDGSFAYFIISI